MPPKTAVSEKKKIGRPTIKTPELIEELCIRVASGRSVTSVTDDDDMPTEATIYNWRIQDVEFFEKLSRAQEIRKEATRRKMIALADRVLTDDKLDHQRAAVAGALWFKAEQISAPRHRVELTGRNGRPIRMDDGEHDLMTMPARSRWPSGLLQCMTQRPG